MKSKVEQLELKVLYDVTRIIGQALDLDGTLDQILSILSESLSMKRATLTLKDQDRETLSIRASHGLNTNEMKRGVYRINEGVTGLIFRTGEPYAIPDVGEEPLFLNKTRSRVIEKRRIAFIGVPIILQGKSFGVLSVDRLFDEDVSFDEDIRFLTVLAGLIAQILSLNHQVEARESRIIRANTSLKSDLSKKTENFFATGSGHGMAEVKELIRKVAPTKAGVLLLGESGTGKSLVAGIIHELSERSRSPFVKINCAALPENLLESELFGYEKGAFTGAADNKLGRVEEADGGTIFLDEIGELPMALQAKLLRFIQEREFERLGSSKTRKVDVRILSATNKDLSEEVSKGSFREDLYYRLNVFPIRVPPLRERPDDIPTLISFFRDKIVQEYDHAPYFCQSAMEKFKEYAWPGNVREMENLVERLSIIFGSKEIDGKDLIYYLDRHENQMNSYQGSGALKEREKKDIVDALKKHRGVQSRAARELGITVRQIGYKIKTFGLEEYIQKK